jgi:cytochrome c oxidase subunit 2
MYSAVRVMTPDQFDKWYIDTTKVVKPAGAEVPGAAGMEVFRTIGCAACHSVDGSKLTGPTLKGIFGHEVTVVTSGKDRNLTVDEAYIKKSILEPNADLVKGFNANLMQTYKGQLSDEEINDIIDYLKTIK